MDGVRRAWLQQDMLTNLVVRDELANKMSFFYAVPTPMLNAIVNATINFVGAVWKERRGGGSGLGADGPADGATPAQTHRRHPGCEWAAVGSRSDGTFPRHARAHRTKCLRTTCWRCSQRWRPFVTTRSTTRSAQRVSETLAPSPTACASWSVS